PSSSQPKKTQRPRKAKRTTEISQSSGPIPLVADETVTKEWEDIMKRAATTASSLEAEQDNDAQTRFKTPSKQSNDPPLSRVNTLGSGEDILKLRELMKLCTKLSKRVLDLETTKTGQAKEIANSRKKLKKLERGKKSRTNKLKRLYKIGSSRRVESSEEASLSDQDDASKQGRIGDIDANINVTLVNEALNDEDLFRVNDLDGEEVIVDKEVVKPVDEEITLAQTLTEVKSTIIKAKGIVMEEPSESTPIISSQQPSQVKVQDKGKGKMVEVEVPMKRKDQIRFDKEFSLKLQEEEENATVAGKPVTISKASIRSDLLFDDADGIDSLNNQAIFDNIQLIGPSPSIAIPDINPKGSGGNHGGQSSNDTSLSGNEDGLTLQSVYDLCVSLCKQVTTQAKEIKALKAQVKKLKKGVKPLITHHKAWMKSVALKTRLARKTSLKKKGVQKGQNKFIQDIPTGGASRRKDRREVLPLTKEQNFFKINHCCCAQRKFLRQQRARGKLACLKVGDKGEQMRRVYALGGERCGSDSEVIRRDNKGELRDGVCAGHTCKLQIIGGAAVGSVSMWGGVESGWGWCHGLTGGAHVERRCLRIDLFATSDLWRSLDTWHTTLCVELKDGTIIYMLVEKRYPLSKELLQQMFDLGLEVQEESIAALQLVVVHNPNYTNDQNLLVSTKPLPSTVQPAQSDKHDLIRSGVGVDTAYAGIGYDVLEFLGVGTTHGYAVSSLMDTAYWLSE
ncbi:hypothetical protein Tco_0493174, partial [Tanacetum coccineum]